MAEVDSGASQPWFSVAISVYNRAAIVRRCVTSCLDQSFPDFEVVVVDDGSADETPRVLRELAGPRVRVVTHPRNRGLSAARDTGVQNARGRWIVQLDSDHGLRPGALENLFERTSTVPQDVGVIGSRYLWDTGRVTPSFVPDGVIDYRGFIRWCEEEGGTDYLCCYRRELAETVRWPVDRRGPLDAIFQLDLARATKSWIAPDVIAMEYSDAAVTQTRSKGSRAARILLDNAPDLAWQYDEILRRHGAALAADGPRTYRMYHRLLGLHLLLAGHRRAGASRALRYLRWAPLSARGWTVLALGLVDRRLLAWARSRR